MNANKLAFLILFWSILNSLAAFGQMRKAITSIENQYLIANIDNSIRIVAQQDKPVSIKQLSATFHTLNSKKVPIEIKEGYGYFIIRPDTIGIVELSITLGDTIETSIFRVKPITAVGQLGRYKANTDEKFGVGEFKAQLGITAVVECCGFDARCEVLGYQVLRISNKNQVEKTINKGGSFEEKTREIISKAESKDMFIFRQIKYRCSSMDEPQRLDDMIFEIK